MRKNCGKLHKFRKIVELRKKADPPPPPPPLVEVERAAAGARQTGAGGSTQPQGQRALLQANGALQGGLGPLRRW